MNTTTRSICFCGYEFDGPYTSANSLKDQAGIYVVCDLRADRKWYVLDVGESETVRTRVENHDRSGCWRAHQRGTLGYAVLYTRDWSAHQRRILEGRIREQFSPPCGER